MRKSAIAKWTPRFTKQTVFCRQCKWMMEEMNRRFAHRKNERGQFILCEDDLPVLAILGVAYDARSDWGNPYFNLMVAINEHGDIVVDFEETGTEEGEEL